MVKELRKENICRKIGLRDDMYDFRGQMMFVSKLGKNNFPRYDKVCVNFIKGLLICHQQFKC